MVFDCSILSLTLFISDTDKTDQIFERFPTLCEQNTQTAGNKIEQALSSINWRELSRIKSSEPEKLFMNSISELNTREPECFKICDEKCTDEDSRLCGLLAESALCLIVSSLKSVFRNNGLFILIIS